MPPVKPERQRYSNGTPYASDSFVVAIKTEDLTESAGTNPFNAAPYATESFVVDLKKEDANESPGTNGQVNISELYDELRSLRAMISSNTVSTENVKTLTEEVSSLRRELTNVIERGQDEMKNVIESGTEEMKNVLENSKFKELKNVGESVKFQQLTDLIESGNDKKLDNFIESEKCENLVTVAESGKEKELNRRNRKDKECKDNNMYMGVQAVLEESFQGHQGNDLYDRENCSPETCYMYIRVKRTSKLEDLLKIASATLTMPVENLRVWPIMQRNNGTYRPTSLAPKSHSKKLIQLAKHNDPWTIFLETPTFLTMPKYDTEFDVLLFLKLYDSKMKTMAYCGHHIMPTKSNIADIIPILCQRGGFPFGTEFILFEEVRPRLVKPIVDFHSPIEKVVDALRDGDIIVFQERDPLKYSKTFPTAKEYFRNVFERFEVSFFDITRPYDEGFQLVLSKNVKHHKVARAVGEYLNDKSCVFHFFVKGQGPSYVGQATFNGTLGDLFENASSTPKRKIFYQKLSTKREFYIL